jgi:hypothetical protein
MKVVTCMRCNYLRNNNDNCADLMWVGKKQPQKLPVIPAAAYLLNDTSG